MLRKRHLRETWESDLRWKGIRRPYSADDVERLRGSVDIKHTLAEMGAERLWNLLRVYPYVTALGALSGNQAVQMVKAGLKAIYCSGWQVAGDANTAGQMYPDQSLYPSNSVPELIRRINNAFQRADQVQHAKGKDEIYWYAPIVADAEAGFGGNLNAFELTKAMIEAGAAGIHFEDQQSALKKCGHMGGKVLVPAMRFVQKIVSARLAADAMNVPTMLIARTDAEAAKLVTSDIDPVDAPFIAGRRTSEGYYQYRGGVEACISRGLAYSPYADMLWMETSEPDLDEARAFAEGIHSKFPHKMLFYNCSPSFNWKKKLDARTIAKFQQSLGELEYRFQFVTLAGWHALNHSIFALAKDYVQRGMSAYADFQQKEFEAEAEGYTAVRHQEFVGTGYFDEISRVISGGDTATLALVGSTEESQFHAKEKRKGAKGAAERPAEGTIDIDDGQQPAAVPVEANGGRREKKRGRKSR
jgi:isocitrate lyase